MAILHVVTNLTFEDRPQAVVSLPGDSSRDVLEKVKTALEESGLQLRPGYIEKRKSHAWYVDGADTQEALRESISKAFAPYEGIELRFFTDKDKEPPVYNSRFARELHKHAPEVYNNSARVAGAMYLTGAMGIMQSALFDEKVESERNNKPTKRWFKRFAAANSMVSALITMFYGDEPSNQRDIHTILKGVQREYENIEHPDPEEVLKQKDTMMQEMHNYTRRLPWVVSGFLNFISVTSRFVDQIFKKNRSLGNLMELGTSAVFMVSNFIRSFVPQDGGQAMFDTEKLASKLPWKPDMEKVEERVRELPLGDELVDDTKLIADKIKKAPLKISGDMANLAEITNIATGFIKGDSGLQLRSATVIGGNSIRRAANKKLGIGFDTLVTAAADFIEQWKYPGATLDQKIAILTRDLSREPEIFHTARDMARGIRARLGLADPEIVRKNGGVTVSAEVAPTARYLPKEKWVKNMPVNLLETDASMQGQANLSK